jgi:hypothetical protein
MKAKTLAAVLVAVAAVLEQSAILRQEFPNTLDTPEPEPVVVLHNFVFRKDPRKDTMLQVQEVVVEEQLGRKLVLLAEADTVVLEVAQARQTGQRTSQMIVPVPVPELVVILRRIVFQRQLHMDSIVGRKLPIGFAVDDAPVVAAEDNP